MANIEKDEISGVETTGHEWDGIKELNNPLPKWWLGIFYASIVFSLGYVIVYPAIPLINGATGGLFGWSSRAEVMEDIKTVEDGNAAIRGRIAEADFDTIRGDEQLTAFAINAGRSAFAVNCSQCHGSGAQGFAGYPNLNDDAWLWGGEIEEIHHTIAHGVRAEEDDDTRFSEMPAFGDMLESDQISDVSDYVLALGGLDHDADAAARGEAVYLDNCAACHGEDGGGDPGLGAPKLADAIWLFAGDKAQIVSQIKKPKHGVMPAWGKRLDAATVKELALYVHSLGGGR